jgi:transcriptional regulator with XRE-family HTH domain
MTERVVLDPITTNAVAFMRRSREELGWSAEFLAYCCEVFGDAQEPPVPSSLSRSRIAKLEVGRAATIRIDEAFLLAGAFGVRLQDIITNSPDTVELRPYVPATDGQNFPSGPVRERLESMGGELGDLRERVADLIDVLGELGIRGLPPAGRAEA